MNPILFSAGSIVLPSYATLVIVGLLVGSALAVAIAQREPISSHDVVDVFLASGLGGLFLAHAAYVCAHWQSYEEPLRHALRPWQGGLLWQGAALGATIGAATICARRELPLLQYLDLLAPGAACLAIFAWLGCMMVGCAWGRATYPHDGVLWALSLDLPDLYGVWEPRVAVQLLGAGSSLVILALLLTARRHLHTRGAIFALWLGLHSLTSYALGTLRADRLVSVGGLRVDQIANLLLSIMALCIFLRAMTARRD